MSFLEHLDELRKRLIVSIAALFLGVLIAFAFVSQIFAFMMLPLQETLPAGGTLIYTEPTEAFYLYIKMASLAGVFIASPIILWQVWLFVAPGLYAEEKKFAIPFVVFSTLFFVSGGLFSHFVAFRWAWAFFGSFSTETVEFMPRIAPVFSLYTRLYPDATRIRLHLSDADTGLFPRADGDDHAEASGEELQVCGAGGLHRGCRAHAIP